MPILVFHGEMIHKNHVLTDNVQTCGGNNCYLKGSVQALVSAGCVSSGIIATYRPNAGLWGAFDVSQDRNGGELPGMPVKASSAQDCQTQCYK